MSRVESLEIWKKCTHLLAGIYKYHQDEHVKTQADAFMSKSDLVLLCAILTEQSISSPEVWDYI